MVTHTDIHKNICDTFEIESDGTDRFVVHTPFSFDDGDGFVVILKKTPEGWVFTDDGHTFFHLEILGIRWRKVADSILAGHGVRNVDGVLTIQVCNDRFGDALCGFLQALSRLCTRRS